MLHPETNPLRQFALFLRSLLFTVIMVVATVVWACVCLLAAPLPYNKRFWVTSRWNVFVIWCAKVICGIRYQVKGYENLPDAPAILLSKHQSAWETIFLLPNMPRLSMRTVPMPCAARPSASSR